MTVVLNPDNVLAADAAPSRFGSATRLTCRECGAGYELAPHSRQNLASGLLSAPQLEQFTKRPLAR